MDRKSELKFSSKLIPLSSLQKRFEFVPDECLQDNLAITLQYVIFLTQLEHNYDLPGTARFLTYKDIILHTASIVECTLSYTLQQMMQNSSWLGIEEYKYPGIKVLYQVDNTTDIIGGTRKKVVIPIDGETNFYKLNLAAKKNRLFTRKLYEASDGLRKLRNRIHLNPLTSREDFYSHRDVEEAFASAGQIIDVCESKLTTLVANG